MLLATDFNLEQTELVLKAWAWYFRKDDKETYVELANQSELVYDDWFGTHKVEPDYENVKQMVLIDQLKRCVHDDLKTHLDEHNVETLHEMAALADDYVLSFKQKQCVFSKSNSDCCSFGVSGSGQAPTGVSSGSNAGNKPCYDSHSSGTSGSRHSSSGGESSKVSPEVKPEGFVSSVKPVDRTPIVEEITDPFDPKYDVRDEYRPSVSVDSVSFVDSVSTSVPVKILCDTRTTQTLDSKHTLHLIWVLLLVSLLQFRLVGLLKVDVLVFLCIMLI